MMDTLLFIALPYVAMVTCVMGTWYRLKYRSLTYSALSSQFLETNGLMWGSLPFHIGITLIILAHIAVFIAPQPWQQLISYRPALLAIESLGLGLSFLCLFGTLTLAIRRMTSSKVQSVTSVMDLVVLVLLILQIVLGMATAVHYKWGAFWSAGTMCPYVWSLVCLRPDVAFIQDMPPIIKAHVVGAWLLILIIPFSRLIHMFAAPLEYLSRPPINVIWTNPRRNETGSEVFVKEEARRHFLKGGIGVTIGLFLLSAGALDKIFRFFFGPRLSVKEETEQMQAKLRRLEATTEQRKLELERQQNDYILVAKLNDLKPDLGKYFIDFEMRPAIAFRGADGLPLLISAKCTHLGCTVGNQVKDGKILCPCHVSYFDVETGQPNVGAPAKAPLPHLNWVLMDPKGKLLASKAEAGKQPIVLPEPVLAEARVYIKKEPISS
ncbi:MAG: respiratory nitrate reductase subunit gamma [Candidatus Obscuribacterales bacterium]